MRETPIVTARASMTLDGRIPFRIRIGVTGHRDIGDHERLENVVCAQVRRIVELLPSSATEIQLTVVSQLAEGADRLIVDQLLADDERGEEAHLEVVLPVESERYAELQRFTQASREEFERLLDRATVQSEPAAAQARGSEDRAAAYEAAGREVVGRCDVLVALWDGGPSGGRGGTAETLLYAAARSKPCVWISTEDEPTVRDNLAEGSARAFHGEVAAGAAVPDRAVRDPDSYPDSTLAALGETFSMLDQFNREELPADYESRLEQELGSGGVADWVAGPFIRSTLLAARWQRRFRWFSWAISLFATAAAAMLAMSLSFGGGSTFWPWAEAGFLACALAGLVVVRRGGFHGRWLSYRVLAERLRSAHYLAPTGADFRRQARLEAVFVGDRSEDWLMRAFEEVWDRRPRDAEDGGPEGDDLVDLKWVLANEWIGSQISYHESAARYHRRRHRVLATIVALLFVATLVFAILHSLHVAEHASTFFSITLPAAGASLGALLTINQHHALSERSSRMLSDLAVVRRAVLAANAEMLDKASSEAARAIAQETGAWFGAMWFLDIEHP